MEASDKLVLCYNRSCGQRFDPSKNASTSCTYHPGTPVFHDAYKGWSCCNTKKTTDFTEFLNIKGCTQGLHSNVKPPEAEKSKSDNNSTNEDEIIMIRAPLKPSSAYHRPSEDTAMIQLKSSIGPSLKSKLEDFKLQKTDLSIGDTKSGVIAIGTSCKNGGCRKSYECEDDNTETCMHHPGAPIFHEGMKYWTCCLRKTTDFNNFLEQVGCTVGKHVWIKVKTLEENRQSCRYDWYQTGAFVFVSVYAKLPIPDESKVEGNPVKLRINVVFEEIRNTFELDLTLVGVIDVQNSEVIYSANKVEIKLKKAEPMSWSKLALPQPVKITDSTNTVELNALSIS